MAGSHSHRSGDAKAPATGACNRGFVSADPERQREDAADEARAVPDQPSGGFRFDVRRLPGAVRTASKPAGPKVAGQGAGGGKRRKR